MIVIQAKVLAGTHIDNAAMDILRLSKQLNCIVEFDFNGVGLFATPTMDSHEKVVATYHEKLKGMPHTAEGGEA